ncbi:hypothetical protein AN214_04396 [Pseudoalteromonas sp. P1-9]|nr:hypothetical protein AN214_04396 [Pseudoalteromonas sp. P1-9]
MQLIWVLAPRSSLHDILVDWGHHPWPQYQTIVYPARLRVCFQKIDSLLLKQYHLALTQQNYGRSNQFQ